MFLRQQPSKESLFATLPDKYKVMSPTNKRTLNRAEDVDEADQDMKNYSEETFMKQDSKLQVERELSLNFHERLSKLVLVTKKEEHARLLKTNHGYGDLLTFQKSIEKLRDLNLKSGDVEEQIKVLHVEQDDAQRRKVEFRCEAETDVVTMGGRVRSPEKKSVRFLDELLLEKQTREVDGSGGNVALIGVGESPERFEKQDSRNTEVNNHDDKTLRRSNSTSQIGILRKKLSQNPFNLRREATIENPSNLRRETNESDFRCQECDKTFKYRSNLKTHVLTVHNGAMCRSNGTTYFNSTDDFFICDVCSRCFKYLVNLRAHKASHARCKLSSTI